MAFKNFKVETDADGIALVTWDIPGRSMNVLDETTILELEEIVKQTSADAAVKGVVVDLGQGGVLRWRRSVDARGHEPPLWRSVEGEGRGRGQPDAVRREPEILAGIPRHRNLRQALGRRHQRACARRRVRADAVVPLPRRRGKPQDPARPARGQGWPVPRRWRHPARAAHRGAARCDAIVVEGRGGQSGESQDPEADRRHRAAGRSHQGCERLDQGRRQSAGPLGRQEL